jgi:hypothetical protein
MLVLAVAAWHRAAAPVSPRVLSDRAAFHRYVAGWPGRFARVRVFRQSIDVVCAHHYHPRYRLCGRVSRGPDGVRSFHLRSAA